MFNISSLNKYLSYDYIQLNKITLNKICYAIYYILNNYQLLLNANWIFFFFFFWLLWIKVLLLLCRMFLIMIFVRFCSGPFFVKVGWAGLPPVVLGRSILSMRVKTGPTTTQLGPACTQTIPRLPGARLRWIELFQMGCGKQI